MQASNGTAVAPEALADWLEQLGCMHPELTRCLPGFLIVSPAKTGTTWLALNLRCHPQLFVPAIKEVKYFSTYSRWLDLNWYLEHFRPANGRLAGEASPPYALLPRRTIRLIRALIPDLKLIVLLRDPVARAWSHAKHCYHYREANFEGFVGDYHDVPESLWAANFTNAWTLAHTDYLGQLDRWLSAFPKEQLYVGFYESLQRDPQGLLRDIFQFLGVRIDLDFSTLRVAEVIHASIPGELPPALAPYLRSVLAPRTRVLATFMESEFHLRPPPEWDRVLGEDQTHAPAGPSWGLDDDVLLSLLEEEGRAAEPRLIKLRYHGYHILFWRGAFYALPEQPGWGTLEKSAVELAAFLARRRCIMAASLAAVQEAIIHKLLPRSTAPRTLGARLKAGCSRLTRWFLPLRASPEENLKTGDSAVGDSLHVNP